MTAMLISILITPVSQSVNDGGVDIMSTPSGWSDTIVLSNDSVILDNNSIADENYLGQYTNNTSWINNGNHEVFPINNPKPQYAELTMTFSKGWNLVSLPLEQSNTSLDIVLSSIDGKWDMIQIYDPLSSDHWKSYNPFKPSVLNDQININRTLAFWINITEIDVIEVVNEIVDDFDIHIPTGITYYLDHGNIINCTLYIEFPGAGYIQISNDGLNYTTGAIYFDEPLLPGWILHAFYNYSVPFAGLTVSGNIPTSTDIPLYAGWNLVGYPTLCNTKVVADAFSGTSVDKVEVFDPAEPYKIKNASPTYLMKPGEGYWVHVPSDTTWIVDW